jgi:hypothetical protein
MIEIARAMFAIGLGILSMIIFRVFLDVWKGRW